jgi:hypothetical protein
MNSEDPQALPVRLRFWRELGSPICPGMAMTKVSETTGPVPRGTRMRAQRGGSQSEGYTRASSDGRG